MRHRDSGGLDGYQDGSGLTSAQRKGGVAQPHGHGIPAGPDLFHDLKGLPGYEAQFQQAPADRGLRLVTEALGVFEDFTDYAAGAFSQ
jgi:hypothetical protein